MEHQDNNNAGNDKDDYDEVVELDEVNDVAGGGDDCDAGAPKRSQIWDWVPNGTKVPKWSQKSPDFASKSQISDSTFR